LTADALLVPVPLRRWLLWHRGFNQSAMLARETATATGVDLAMDALVRAKETLDSVGMGRAARAPNVLGVFRVADRARVRGRTVVLIDDVMTTGATAEACAHVVRRAGARAVHILTFARVVRTSDEAYRPGASGPAVSSGAGARRPNASQLVVGDDDGEN
jgi:predicted amidophosphoribosyltransferase